MWSLEKLNKKKLEGWSHLLLNHEAQISLARQLIHKIPSGTKTLITHNEGLNLFFAGSIAQHFNLSVIILKDLKNQKSIKDKSSAFYFVDELKSESLLDQLDPDIQHLLCISNLVDSSTNDSKKVISLF